MSARATVSTSRLPAPEPLHAPLQRALEKSTGNCRLVSLFEGVEYQVTDPLAIDFAVQHISLWAISPTPSMSSDLPSTPAPAASLVADLPRRGRIR